MTRLVRERARGREEQGRRYTLYVAACPRQRVEWMPSVHMFLQLHSLFQCHDDARGLETGAITSLIKGRLPAPEAAGSPVLCNCGGNRRLFPRYPDMGWK